MPLSQLQSLVFSVCPLSAGFSGKGIARPDRPGRKNASTKTNTRNSTTDETTQRKRQESQGYRQTMPIRMVPVETTVQRIAYVIIFNSIFQELRMCPRSVGSFETATPAGMTRPQARLRKQKTRNRTTDETSTRTKRRNESGKRARVAGKHRRKGGRSYQVRTGIPGALQLKHWPMFRVFIGSIRGARDHRGTEYTTINSCRWYD